MSTSKGRDIFVFLHYYISNRIYIYIYVDDLISGVNCVTRKGKEKVWWINEFFLFIYGTINKMGSIPREDI